jgi:hypothetical protein
MRRRAITALLTIAGILGVWMLVPRRIADRSPSPAVHAVNAIRTIHEAQTQYYSQYNRYATSLAELGPPASGAANASAADLIGNDLANGKKQGYIFTVTGNQGGYIVQARPEVFNTGGSRTFYSDQSMVIHERRGPRPTTAQDQESK